MYSHSETKQTQKTQILKTKQNPEVIGYKWNHKSAQQTTCFNSVLANNGTEEGVGGVVEGWQVEMDDATSFLKEKVWSHVL